MMQVTVDNKNEATIKTPYEALTNLSKKTHILDGVSALLGWDQETYMPPKAAPIRAMQKEYLAELSHSVKTSKEYEECLSKLIDIQSGKILDNSLSDAQIAAAKAWRRDFLHLVKLPTSFVKEFARVTSEAIFVWQQAKSENNYKLFQPHLQHIVDLVRKKADFLGYDDHPYDALLDEYEPEITTKTVESIFSNLKKEIPPLLTELIKRQKSIETPKTDFSLDQNEQIKVCNALLDLIGFDKTCGRLDLSTHPFCSGYHPFDCRITTRVESHGLVSQILTTLHESGHSFYEMGLPPEHYGTPLGEAISLGVHESQSRFWETRIGGTLPFWQFIHPVITRLFPGRFENIKPETIFRSISTVKPSLIRVDADEVTYPLHVILRFEIEKELVAGNLSLNDLPQYWGQKMKELLGVTPPDDQSGCLQDIHWSMGGIGYFPTYTLGNILAAQMFETFSRKFPDWEKRVSSGDFKFIKEWQREEIHCHGRRYNSNELIEKISGRTMDSKPYINYLKEKYLNIFS